MVCLLIPFCLPSVWTFARCRAKKTSQRDACFRGTICIMLDLSRLSTTYENPLFFQLQFIKVHLPQVEQKYIEDVSRLSQLAHGGFSTFTFSISLHIKQSGGGSWTPSFNVVCVLNQINKPFKNVSVNVWHSNMNSRLKQEQNYHRYVIDINVT